MRFKFDCLLIVFHHFGIRYFNFADWISHYVLVSCFWLNYALYSPLSFPYAASWMSWYVLYFIEWMCLLCLACLLHNKVPDFLFHLKKRKAGEAVKERLCWKLSSHLKWTGIRKFLTIKNPLDDLRQ